MRQLQLTPLGTPGARLGQQRGTQDTGAGGRPPFNGGWPPFSGRGGHSRSGAERPIVFHRRDHLAESYRPKKVDQTQRTGVLSTTTTTTPSASSSPSTARWGRAPRSSRTAPPPHGRPFHPPHHARLQGGAPRPDHRPVRPGRHSRRQRRVVRSRRHGHARCTRRPRRDHRRRRRGYGDVPDHGLGDPARLIRTRYDAADITRLLAVAWWDWPVQHITKHVRTMMSGTVTTSKRPPHSSTSPDSAFSPHPRTHPAQDNE